MTRDSFRFGLRECPACGRGIALTRDGRLRRHYVLLPARRLCGASRRQLAEPLAH